MRPCPACGRPMSILLPGKTIARHYCSRACVLRANPPRHVSRELDEVAVIRLVSGDPVRSTKAERREATRLLTERGQSASWIASLLHTTPRSVARYRAELNTNRKAIAA